MNRLENGKAPEGCVIYAEMLNVGFHLEHGDHSDVLPTWQRGSLEEVEDNSGSRRVWIAMNSLDLGMWRCRHLCKTVQ